MVSNGTEWFPANIPSTFHLDLIDNNLISDTYFGLNPTWHD